MRGLQVKDGVVSNIARFGSELPDGWLPCPDGVGKGWLDNGGGTFSPPSAPPLDIDESAGRKRDDLRSKCRQAITTMFQSSALGAQNSYDCRPEDQANIRTRVTASQTDSLSRKVWTHDGVEFTREAHSTPQLEQLNIDMEAHIDSQQERLESLIAAVNACSTVEGVQAITW